MWLRSVFSTFCASSPAPRYQEFDQVKKQMYKVHRPHVESGYIAKVSYEATTNDAGEADWWIYYTPGRNAGREYQHFTGLQKVPKVRKKPPEKIVAPVLPLEAGENNTSQIEPLAGVETGGDAEQPADSPATRELIEALVTADLNRGDAARFARERPEVCRRQLAYLPYIAQFKTSRGAYLRRAIENDFGPPAAYSQAQATQAKAQTAKAQRARELFEAAQEKARQSHEERLNGVFAAFLCERVGEMQTAHPEAFAAFVSYEEEKRQTLLRSPLAERPMFRHTIENFDSEAMRADRFVEWCQSAGQKFGVQAPTFWEWDQSVNENSFQD